MNERIRKLAHEAGIKITPMIVDGIEYEYEDVDMDGSEDLAKFAELIVRECVNKVRARQQFSIEDDHNSQHAFDLLVYDLKSHFGVKE